MRRHEGARSRSANFADRRRSIEQTRPRPNPLGGPRERGGLLATRVDIRGRYAGLTGRKREREIAGEGWKFDGHVREREDNGRDIPLRDRIS